MTKQEIANRINKINKISEATADNVENYKMNIECNGKIYDVYLAGNDEMFDLNEFYQIGIDPSNGKEYKFFFDAPDGDLDDIDYTEAYRMEIC